MELLQQFIGQFNIVLILIIAFVTTIIVSAINTFKENNVHNALISAAVAFVVTLGYTSFEGVNNFADGQKVFVQFTFSLSFAILFYQYLGKWTVDRFFQYLKSFIDKRATEQENK